MLHQGREQERVVGGDEAPQGRQLAAAVKRARWIVVRPDDQLFAGRRDCIRKFGNREIEVAFSRVFAAAAGDRFGEKMQVVNEDMVGAGEGRRDETVEAVFKRERVPFLLGGEQIRRRQKSAAALGVQVPKDGRSSEAVAASKGDKTAFGKLVAELIEGRRLTRRKRGKLHGVNSAASARLDNLEPIDRRRSKKVHSKQNPSMGKTTLLHRRIN